MTNTFSSNFETLFNRLTRYCAYQDRCSRDVELKLEGWHVSKELQEKVMKQLKKASWDHMFGEHLSLYREILVDEEGNLLVFRRTNCLKDCQIFIQVYSSRGEFICETELVEGPFRLAVNPRIKNMCFTSQGLFAMVEVKDAAEFELRLIKVIHK